MKDLQKLFKIVFFNSYCFAIRCLALFIDSDQRDEYDFLPTMVLNLFPICQPLFIVLFVKNICIVIYFLTKITNKIEFRETIEGSNWHDFYSDQVAQKKLFGFKKFLSKAIQKHALMRKIFCA